VRRLQFDTVYQALFSRSGECEGIGVSGRVSFAALRFTEQTLFHPARDAVAFAGRFRANILEENEG
jgi:hypothetical protein